MEIVIRKADARIALQIGITRMLIWRYTYTHVLPERVFTDMMNELWDNASVGQHAQSSVYAAIANNAVIGYVSYGRSTCNDYRNMGEIYDIGVIPSFQGKGVGSLLLDSCRKTLKADGLVKTIVKVPKWSPFVYFFTKHGASMAHPVSKVVESMGGEPVTKNILVM